MTATERPDLAGGGHPATVGTGRRRYRIAVLLALVLLVVLGVIASVTVGVSTIPLTHLWHVLTVRDGSDADVVVHTMRIPRTALGAMVGAALGTAGALMQGHTRNPLAEPGLLGVSAGAAFMVVLAIHVLGVVSPFGFVWFAFAGALVASVVVFAVGAAGRGGATPVTLALAGAAVSALLGALTSGLVLMRGQTLDAYRFWADGSLAGRDPGLALQIAPFLVVGIVLALVNAPGLNLLALGEDVARGLGADVARTRRLGLAAITVLTGAGVAACGPIWFVGLIVPHLARRLTGPDQRWLVPAAGLAGAALLLGADVVGRVVARPAELPVGIMLAVLGVPVFIVIVRRRRLVGP